MNLNYNERKTYMLLLNCICKNVPFFMSNKIPLFFFCCTAICKYSQFCESSVRTKPSQSQLLDARCSERK